MKNTVFLDEAPRSPVHRYPSTLKVETARSSETSVTAYPIPEENSPHFNIFLSMFTQAVSQMVCSLLFFRAFFMFPMRATCPANFILYLATLNAMKCLIM
jgi:hypothetical protein